MQGVSASGVLPAPRSTSVPHQQCNTFRWYVCLACVPSAQENGYSYSWPFQGKRTGADVYMCSCPLFHFRQLYGPITQPSVEKAEECTFASSKERTTGWEAVSCRWKLRLARSTNAPPGTDHRAALLPSSPYLAFCVLFGRPRKLSSSSKISHHHSKEPMNGLVPSNFLWC